MRLLYPALPTYTAFKAKSVCHRCCMDTDDEVRDRATLYLTILQQKQAALNSHYILNGECHKHF